MLLTYRQLGPRGIAQHVERSLADEAEIQRRSEFTRRALIMAGRYEGLILNRVAEVYTKTSTVTKLSHFIRAGTNVMARITRELAFVYARPPMRRLAVEGVVGEALNRRLAAAAREGKLALKAKQWGQYAFAMNVAWVLPGVWERPEGRRLEYQLILPHTAERIYGDDPNYTDILLWPHGPEQQRGDARARRKWCLVDSEAYYWLDQEFEIERVVPHGLGRQPANEIRVSEPPPGDFWDIGRGREMVTATIECGRVAAAMSRVRASQNRKLITVFGQTKNMDKSQAADPDGAITAVSDKGAIEFDVHDFVTAIQPFKDEIRFHIEHAVESYGIPITTVDPEPASTGDAVNVFAPAGPQLHAAQAELRDDQVEYVRPFEHELAVDTHELLARARHPASVNPAIVGEAYEAVWQPLTFIDHPLKRLQVYEKKLALGLMTHADALIEERGGAYTQQQGHQIILRNLELKAMVDLFYAMHNVGADPRFWSVPQVQGRQGGLAQATQEQQ